jgi:hypothetical protein
MVQGGIFIIISNEGRQDKILMASKSLVSRIREIEMYRGSIGEEALATLPDIERTHVLFTNAHFKPFVAIASEYCIEPPSSGNTSLGGQLTFKLPNFGDFVSDMVLHLKLKQPTLSTTADPENQPLMRWCTFPGERVLVSSKISMNSNDINTYYTHDVNFYREFFVGTDRAVGWARCMGQEEPEVGYVDQPNWLKSGVSPSDIKHRVQTVTYSGLQTPTGQKIGFVDLYIPLLHPMCLDVRQAFPLIAIPNTQRNVYCDMIDANRLVELVPRGTGTWADPLGTLDYSGMLVKSELIINNLFILPEVHNIYLKRVGFNMVRVNQFFSKQSCSGDDQTLLSSLKFPIEWLAIGARPTKFEGRFGTDAERRQYLHQWHKFTDIETVTRAAQGTRGTKVSVKNTAYSTPAAGCYFNNNGTATASLRLTDNSSLVEGANNFDGISTGDLITFTLSGSPITGDVSGAVTTVSVSATTTFELEVSEVVHATATTAGYIRFKQTVSELSSKTGFVGVVGSVGIVNALSVLVKRQDSIEIPTTVDLPIERFTKFQLIAQSINLNPEIQSQFYNSYIPGVKFGGNSITTPSKGCYLYSFALYPTAYQPSGHFNASRCREFYISWSSTYTADNTFTLYVCCTGINFMVVAEGTALIRYTT